MVAQTHAIFKMIDVNAGSLLMYNDPVRFLSFCQRMLVECLMSLTC